MHDTIINNELFGQFAVSSVVVELKSLDKLVLAVSIPFESFDNWQASLIGLQNIHRKIFNEILVIFSDDVTLDGDLLFVVFIIFGGVVISGQVEELLLWVLLLIGHFSHVILQILDLRTTCCIKRGIVFESHLFYKRLINILIFVLHFLITVFTIINSCSTLRISLMSFTSSFLLESLLEMV